jgi:hypothetical protein
MTSGRIWGARLAALLVAVIIPACQSTNPGAVGVSSSLWIANSGIGGQPTGTPTFWRDPNLGTTNLYTPDPYDIVTYTRPTIYILGLNHPLMTDVTAKQFPNIVYNETRAMDLMNQHRYKVFVDILGKPLPYTLSGTLVDHTGLRQNARANSRHYPTWHTNPFVPFPVEMPKQTNPEGDNVDARLAKCGLTTAYCFEFAIAGLAYRSGDDVGAYWIATYGKPPPAAGQPVPPGQYLLDTGLTHLAVGFWQLGGPNSQVYYWTAILAKDPNANVTLPNIPFGGPGF